MLATVSPQASHLTIVWQRITCSISPPLIKPPRKQQLRGYLRYYSVFIVPYKVYTLKSSTKSKEQGPKGPTYMYDHDAFR